jgi:hypothetical protein
MDNAPDLMDDTFLLAGRAAAYAPRMLLHESLLPLLLDTAMVSVVQLWFALSTPCTTPTAVHSTLQLVTMLLHTSRQSVCRPANARL